MEIKTNCDLNKYPLLVEVALYINKLNNENNYNIFYDSVISDGYIKYDSSTDTISDLNDVEFPNRFIIDISRCHNSELYATAAHAYITTRIDRKCLKDDKIIFYKTDNDTYYPLVLTINNNK
jgi:hypothetical protein